MGILRGFFEAPVYRQSGQDACEGKKENQAGFFNNTDMKKHILTQDQTAYIRKEYVADAADGNRTTESNQDSFPDLFFMLDEHGCRRNGTEQDMDRMENMK